VWNHRVDAIENSYIEVIRSHSFQNQE